MTAYYSNQIFAGWGGGGICLAVEHDKIARVGRLLLIGLVGFLFLWTRPTVEDSATERSRVRSVKDPKQRDYSWVDIPHRLLAAEFV